MFKSLIVLFTICLLSGLTLGYVNHITFQERKSNLIKEINEAKLYVIDDLIKNKKVTFEKLNKISNDRMKFEKVIYNKKWIATICNFKTQGFSGDIQLMIGISKKGKILGLKPLAHTETPGLGAKINEVKPILAKKIKKQNKKININRPWFAEQFKNKTVDDMLVDKDGGKINSITAATISSRAVTNGIKKVLETYIKGQK